MEGLHRPHPRDAGFPDGSWPEPMSLEEDLAGPQRHRDDFHDRVGFTYTVLDAHGPVDATDVIGCVYLYPDDRPDADLHVQSWVRADRAELDALLATSVRSSVRGDYRRLEG